MTRFAFIFTSFSKTASGFRMDRRSNFTFKNDALFLVVDIYGGDRRNKRLGVRMQRILEQFLGGACLDELAQVHDTNVIRNKAHN